MCGRYSSNTEEEIIILREILKTLSIRLTKNDENNLNQINNKEIFPTNIAPIITLNGIIGAKWGLNKWDNKGIIINARSETINTSKFFSQYLGGGECIIPAKSYFEWQKLNNDKIKYEITQNNDYGLFFAGIFTNTNIEKKFAILTREPTASIKFIHNRMPLILTIDEAILYLTGKLNLLTVANKNYENITYKEVV